MFLSRWLGRPEPTLKPQPAPTFRPTLEALGDRLAPHAGGFGSNLFSLDGLVGSITTGGSANADVTATQFRVQVQRSVFDGAQARVRVVAVDANGRVDRDYTGTVTLTSSDVDAVLPESYTFIPGDFGQQTFLVTLNTGGRQTITASGDDGLTGTATVNVKDTPVVSSLFVQVQPGASANEPTRVLVAALDANNRLVPTYTGTVALTASGVDANLPEDYTFTAADRGVHVFTVTPTAAGELTVTATDTTTATITGSATTTVGEARTVADIVVLARPGSTVGSPVSVLVAAVDANGRPVSGYTGTVTFSSSDAGATLPADYTFTAADLGRKVFEVTFSGSGRQTLTVTDTATGELAGTATVIVRTDVSGGFDFELPGRGHGFGRRRGGFGLLG